MSKANNTQIAIDAGGTMTDAFLVDEHGNVSVGKALTNKEDESISYEEAVDDACKYWDLDSREVHESAATDTYTGTKMLNTLLERKGNRIGLLVTKGHESMYYRERGHSWLGLTWEQILHHKTHKHVAPSMFELDAERVEGITERVSSGSYFMIEEPGTEKVGLNEDETREAVHKLLDKDVESIGINFLFSYLNSDHEKRAAEIAREVADERGDDVYVVRSSNLCPVMKEAQRLKSTLIEARTSDIVRDHLLNIEETAKKLGYQHDEYTVTSYGSVVNVRHPRLYETVISGPTGGLIGAREVGEIAGIENIIAADIGGTSFDVGTIEGGRISLTKEPNFARNRLALPMVDLDSIGSGAGSEVNVDEFSHIELGPESAGSDVGKCLNHPEVTVSDCNAVLGYLPPGNFLGGKVELDLDAAEQAVREEIAEPLGLDMYEAAEGVLDILHTRLKRHLTSTVESKGYTPQDFTLFIYGGAGPLHLHGVSDIDFNDIMTFPFAAAFSAYGVAASEHSKRFHQGTSSIIPPDYDEAAADAIADEVSEEYQALEEQAYNEMESEGQSSEDLQAVFGASMRYLGVLEDLDVTFTFGRIDDAADLEQAIGEFETKYADIYGEGARFPESGFFVKEIFVEVIGEKPTPEQPSYEPTSELSEDAIKGKREAYYDGEWRDFTIFDMEELRAGNAVESPAIVEHPMTTLVVPPGNELELDENRFIHWNEED